MTDEIYDKKIRAGIAEKFIKDLPALKEPLTEIDEEIFHRLVQEVRIGSEDDVEVIWRDGMT